MPVCSKSELASILENMNQKQNSWKLKKTTSIKTPERTAAANSLEALASISASSSPVNQAKHTKVQRSPAPSGIFGYNFKGSKIDQMMTKKEKHKAEDQKQCDESTQPPVTPQATHVLVRSSSLPETAVVNDDALPKLNRSSSNESPGAAIKAALGSGLFASFRRASLAGVLEKVKTHMGEQNMTETMRCEIGEFEQTPSTKVLAFEELAQFNDGEERFKDRATFEIENQSNLRRLRLKSMCQEFESEETRYALDKVSAADKNHSTSRRIQKVWRFDQIAEPPVRPYSGLKKNADAARRPSSAINLNCEMGSRVQVTPRLNQSASYQSSGSITATDQEKTQIPGVVDKMRNENRMKERSSMGPGGFWRAGLNSASNEAFNRKMPDFVASIAEIKNSSFMCDVCQSLRSKDALGRCKYCGA